MESRTHRRAMFTDEEGVFYPEAEGSRMRMHRDIKNSPDT